MRSRPVAPRLLQRTLAALLPLGLAASLAPALLTAPGQTPGQTPGGTTEQRADAAPALRPVAAAAASAPYRTFTLNVAFPLSTAQAMADVSKAMTLGQVGGLQEFSDAPDRAALVRLLTARGWGYYMPRDGGIADPIIWDRDRFVLLDGHSTRVHGPERGVTPGRFINVVRLREVATGKVFGVVNTHTISGASRDAQLTNMHRIPRLRLHLAMLRAEIQTLFTSTEHVFAMGDLNVNYLADRKRRNAGLPSDALGDLVDFDMPLRGSRGPTSLLDYGMSVKDNGGLVRTSSRIVGGFHSDHDAIAFTYVPVDLMATGPVFSRPRGDSVERQRVVSRMARAVYDAEPGATVRLSTTRLDAPELEKALTLAHGRGVAVRIVVGGATASMSERRLGGLLGSDLAATSWIHRCAGACLSTTGTQQANFLTVDRSGATTALTLISSGPAVRSSYRRWTDVYRTSTEQVYRAYAGLFDAMASGRRTTALTGGSVVAGSYRVQVYPVASDPVLKALRPVGCKNARGLRTSDGRTNVRVAVSAWSGARGRAIAARLVALKRQGCDVAAVVDTKVLAGIRRVLGRGGVPVTRSRIGQNLLVVDGRYGRSATVQAAWTGGPTWTDSALRGDGVTLVVRRAQDVAGYLSGFTRAFRGR